MISYSWNGYVWYHWWYRRWQKLRLPWRWRFALSTPSFSATTLPTCLDCPGRSFISSLSVCMGSILYLLLSTWSPWCCESQSSSSAAETRVSTNIWWAMKCWKEFGYASGIVYLRWIRRHCSLKWPLSMPPISTTCMLTGTQENILLAIGFASCSWTFLFCFATWLLQRWCDACLHAKCSIMILIQMTSHVIP